MVGKKFLNFSLADLGKPLGIKRPDLFRNALKSNISNFNSLARSIASTLTGTDKYNLFSMFVLLNVLVNLCVAWFGRGLH